MFLYVPIHRFRHREPGRRVLQLQARLNNSLSGRVVNSIWLQTSIGQFKCHVKSEDCVKGPHTTYAIVTERHDGDRGEVGGSGRANKTP